MKAHQLTGALEPFRGKSTKANQIIFLGNIVKEDERTWPYPGVELKVQDVFRRVNTGVMQTGKKRKIKSETLAERRIYLSQVLEKEDPSRGYKKPQAKTLLRDGFRRGDGFLIYGDGSGLVIRKRMDNRGFWLARMTKNERAVLVNEERSARRNLRWDRGSFCYGEETRHWKP